MVFHCFWDEYKVFIMTCMERYDLAPAYLARLISQHFPSCSPNKLRKVRKADILSSALPPRVRPNIENMRH